MKKGNIVDLRAYRKRDKQDEPTKATVSKELQHAIKRLIQRLRKQGPMKRLRRA
jgi:hypothetical protein